jgi:hypothetical protein
MENEMITLDSLRTALLGPDPYEGIDQLIRLELADGRTTASVHEELLPLVKPLRSTRTLSEDAEEALLGALDGLLGNCHPQCDYRTTR